MIDPPSLTSARSATVQPVDFSDDSATAELSPPRFSAAGAARQHDGSCRSGGQDRDALDPLSHGEDSLSLWFAQFALDRGGPAVASVG
ncbi:hypothetical protein Q9Q99_17955 [Curtobacterium flaccumfaciens]|nr:hypothetical protein Q9Q99_17955 [Curtobacterium flaccumfaciens]